MATAQWIKEAEEQARKYSDAIKQSNQYLVDQLNASKANTLDELQRRQQNELYNLNTNESTINQNALDNARQLNINRLLALKSNEQAMNRAGLGSQGIVGSQVNSINNNYGTNLSSVLNEKNNELNNLARQRNDLNTDYDTNRLNLINQYDNNLSNLQQEINDRALNQYNNIYNSYLALRQQEYENEQAEKAREEARRQWEAEYALNKLNADRNYYLNTRKASNTTNNSNSRFSENNAGNNNGNTTSEKIYEAQYSPNLSSGQASTWFANQSKGNALTANQLAAIITEGLNSGILNERDKNKIFKAYNLK